MITLCASGMLFIAGNTELIFAFRLFMYFGATLGFFAVGASFFHWLGLIDGGFSLKILTTIFFIMLFSISLNY